MMLISTRSSISTSESSIDSLTDEEVYNLMFKIQWEGDSVGYDPSIDFGIPPVFRIAPDAVAKLVRRSNTNESYTMQYVASRSNILIPTVRRVLPNKEHANTYWIVMDYVEGETLQDAWPRMSWWRRLWVVWTLRRYMRQLHRLPLPNPGIPGPADGSGEPLRCYAPHLPYHGAGPFASYDELAKWHDCQRYCHQVRSHQMFRELWRCPKFDMSSPLVLCHADLHLRNIMVDNKEGRVWLLDWANSGAFPPWWDYVHLAGWADAWRPAVRLPKTFSIFLPFMVGNYGRLYREYWKDLTAQIQSVDCEELQTEVVDYFEKLGIYIDV